MFRTFCLGLLLCLPALATAATDPQALRSEIDAKVTEIDRLRQQLADEQQAAATLRAELGRLREATTGLEQRKRETLAAFREQFERVIADPTQELSGAQQDYRGAFEALAARGEAVTTKERELAEREAQVAQARDAAARAGERLTALRADLNQARLERLFRELNVVGEVSLTSTVTCAPDETIAGCIARAEDTAKELARTRFRDQLLAAVTEADVVAGQRADADAMPTLIDSNIRSGGFQGQGDYVVELSAELRNEITRPQACALLKLSEAECRGEAAPLDTADAPTAEETAPAEVIAVESLEDIAEEPEETEEPEPAASGNAQYRLTVRSNVYYDEVFIDGVAYGSTKLDVMLPPGEYDVEVRKPGHSVYRERIALSDTRTVTATLFELDQ
jgi:hypothetical protein